MQQPEKSRGVLEEPEGRAVYLQIIKRGTLSTKQLLSAIGTNGTRMTDGSAALGDRGLIDHACRETDMN